MDALTIAYFRICYGTSSLYGIDNILKHIINAGP
jgi:hypothetical protein